MRKLLLILWIGFLPLSTLTTVDAMEVTPAELALSSQYVMVWNVDEQIPVYEKNAHEKMYPASLTKIMTTLVALEHINNLRTEIVFEPEVLEGLEAEKAELIGYQEGDHARLMDLLYGMMLTTGADATRAIAIHVAGSEASFVDLMNQKAQELELEHTHFTNVIGRHDEDHYTTAADMAVILNEAMKQEAFYRMFTANRYTSVDGSRQWTATRDAECRALGIQNDFLIGSKNGYTQEGGLCLASLIETADTSYLVVSGKAGSDAFSGEHLRDVERIYHYVQTHYENATIYQKREAISDVEVRYGSEPLVAIAPHSDVKILVEKGTDAQVNLNTDFSVSAPIRQGEAILQLKVSSPSLGLTKTYSLYAMAEVSRDWLPYLCHQWWVIALLIIGVIAIVMYGIHQRQATLMVRDIQQRVNRTRRDQDESFRDLLG